MPPSAKPQRRKSVQEFSVVVLTRHDCAAEDEMLGLHVRDGPLDVIEVVRERLQQRHPRAATQTPDTAESCG